MRIPERGTVWFAGAVAVVATVGAVLLRWLLDPWLGDYVPLATLYGAVALAVWAGGWRAAVPALVVGYLGCHYLFVGHFGVDFASPRVLVGIIAYSISGGLIIAIGEAMRAARSRAELASARFEQELAQRQAAEQQLQEVNRRLAGDIAGRERLTNEREELVGRLEHHSRRMQLLWEAAVVLLSADDPDAMLKELFARIGPHFGLDAYFNYVEEEGDVLRLASCGGVPEEAARGFARLEYGQAVCGNVALRRAPIIAHHIQQSDDPHVQLVKSLGMRAYVCNPLLEGGRLLGTLSFGSRSKDAFAADELEFLRIVCRYVAAAYERLRLIRELRDSDRRKNEFLATLAHELRNPLAPIGNAAQLLKARSPLAPELAWVRDVIDRQVSNMVRLLEDLLDVSRISRNKLQLRKGRFELRALLNMALETTQSAIESGGHQLSVDLPADPIWLDADAVRLAQVFGNLLHNACKYTEPGGAIRLSAYRLGNEVTVSIQDNGIGFDPKAAPRLFEMFSQAKPALERAQGGLGIGLSLVKAVIELHGGAVEARSEGTGTGAELLVRLPVADAAGDAPQALPWQEDELQPEIKRRILVVDDHQDNTDSLAMMLRAMGSEVIAAYNGDAAVELAAQMRPDAVLLDIGMPGLNGYDTCRRIRREPWGNRILVVALTGWGQPEDRQRTGEAGFDYHLVKPVDPVALAKVLSAGCSV